MHPNSFNNPCWEI